MAAAAALGPACVGRISDRGPSAGGGSSGAGGAGTGAGGAAKPVPLDVGRVAMHRLNNAEYDNTVRDLLGVSASAAASFIPDEKALGFDTIAEAFTMSDARFEQYFDAAGALVDQAFADPALRARVVTCAAPAAPATDTACTRAVVAAFGRRAWRRPLADAEVARLVKVAGDALALGEDWLGSVKQALRAMLVAPQFLYRVELDPAPDAPTAHALGGDELATRLSYLLWSTMPDERLFALADGGRLADDAVLDAEVDRLLADPRGAAFAASFAGQWLGLRDLASHQVEPTAFPAWNEPLRQAMIAEGLQFFSAFLTGARPMSEFLTARVDVTDARLAAFYGAPASAAARPGFLGLGAFLTVSSFSYRTAPTLRGKWVLENLLCDPVPPPPPDVPEIDDGNGGSPANQAVNVRARLAAHRENPGCAVCHDVLDPIGLGLEGFDGIGQLRTQYPGGDAIDTSGVMPDGARFDGLGELAALLGADPRFLTCASRKLMIYTLSRDLGPSDVYQLEDVRARWREQGLGLRALVKLLVLHPTFRNRHG